MQGGKLAAYPQPSGQGLRVRGQALSIVKVLAAKNARATPYSDPLAGAPSRIGHLLSTATKNSEFLHDTILNSAVSGYTPAMTSTDTIRLNDMPHLDKSASGFPFAGHYCPKCLSGDVNLSQATRCNAIGNLTQVGYCNSCHASWANVFSLDYYVDLTDEVSA